MNDTRKLLVSLPFVGVLTLALYGVGSIAKEKSVNSSCQSNLKQVGLGLMQYVRDYDEMNPLAGNWATVLQPYTKNPLIFDCPSTNGYSFNRYLSGLSLSQIDPAKVTPTVFDSTSTQPNSSDFGTSYITNGAHSIWKRGRGSNVMFFDAHVEWVQVKPVFQAIIPLPTPPPIYRYLKPEAKPRNLRQHPIGGTK